MRSSGVRRTLTDQSGFTLIELLGVAVILIILAVMALPVYAEVTDRTREGKTQEQLRIIEQALEAYRADATYGGHYPDTLQELVDNGFLKRTPAGFQTPWSSPATPAKRIFYYYGVDQQGAATKFVLGDPGPNVVCSGDHRSPACGNENGTAETPENMYPTYPSEWVRRSH